MGQQPWSGKATVTLVETDQCHQRQPPYRRGGRKRGGRGPLRPWEKRRYRVSCAKLGDAWLIENLEVLETLEPDPTPTPEPVVTTPGSHGAAGGHAGDLTPGIMTPLPSHGAGAFL